MGEPSTSAPRFDGTMLKFLTHKLRTHSINEDPNLHQEKADDDHDSGTESDDEFANGGDIAEEISTALDSLEEAGGGTARDSAVPSDADLGVSPPSTIGTPSQFGYGAFQLQAQPSSSSGCSSTETPPIEQPNYEFLLRLGHSDQHSSEEELEVINGPKGDEATTTTLSTSKTPSLRTPLPVRPSAVPEKRKWSEANSGSASCTLMHQKSAEGGEPGTTYSAPASRLGRENNSGSSDEEGACYAPPVQFRTSPPTDTHKPVRSMSPPSKLFHASFSSSCLSSAAGSSSFEQPHPHRSHHHHHHHRPRSRPRPHSQYHSHTSLDHQSHQLQQQQQHNPHHSQQEQQPIAHQNQQQQDPVDLDSIGACSPRKRHRHHRHSRPCLDFEKMQQLKTQTVPTWRHASEHNKELSVFCW